MKYVIIWFINLCWKYWFDRQVFDKNGNGMVSVHDLKHSLTTLGERLADEELDELVREVDQDGEGQLNYDGQWCMWLIACSMMRILRCEPLLFLISAYLCA